MKNKIKYLSKVVLMAALLLGPGVCRGVIGHRPILPEPISSEVVLNVPALQNFTLSDSEYREGSIFLEFVPKSGLNFRLQISLTFESGRDVLSGRCLGDEKWCKAVGSGTDCTGSESDELFCYGTQDLIIRDRPGGGIGDGIELN